MSAEAEAFVSEHPRSILISHRSDGGLQASPVRVLVDSEGRITATTREATVKARNLTRDARVTLCVIDDGWSGPWMTIEGTAEIVRLPDALPALREFYEHRDGKLPDPDVFVATMEREGRVIIRVAVERTTPPPQPRG